MKTKIPRIGWIIGVFLLMLVIGCKGSKGSAGPAGDKGDPGIPAVDKGSISGTVKDAATDNPIEGATVETSPVTSTAITNSTGAFIISNAPIGVYSVTATKSGYVVYTLTGVGVAAGGTTSVSLVIAAESPVLGPGIITGTVKNAVGTGIQSATVSVEGQSASAITDASGNFSISNVTPGFVYLYVAKPAGSSYLDGETRNGIYVAAGGTVSGVSITLSSRPSDFATFIGGAQCAACHTTENSDESVSAHYHSITSDTSRMISLGVWPSVGGTVDPGITANSPVDGSPGVSVYLCQNSSGVYSMKFGGTANCLITTDGTIVPVSGTYGGEGDGGIDNVQNVGKFKQRFLAKLADVSYASSWTYNSPADKARDYLILPVQITQSGDGAPKWGAYKNTEWTQQKRTFSRACAGCHNTGMTITWETSTGNNYITAYDYLDLNITCEKCHGPGSEHRDEPTATKKLKIIIPKYLTAVAERNVCGQCHAADAGKSKVPDGSFGYAYNSANASLLGSGTYVPGVYDPADYIKGFGVTVANGGGFDAWNDGIHGKAHRQQYPELAVSVHTNNPYEKLTCSSCHNTHTLRQGPKDFTVVSGADTYVFNTPTFKNNLLCLGCHAPYGPFASLTKAGVAAVFVDAGGTVTKNGSPYAPSASEISAAKNSIASSVGQHMEDEVNMGVAAYNPLNDNLPVGRCQSCHMPKTGKSGGYTTGVDGNGDSALIEGDQGSHAFDIIWPWQSAALKKSSGGTDTDIMPNSCGKCHEGSRLSGN